MKINRKARRDGGRGQLVDALRAWEKVSMAASMRAFLQYAKEHGLSVPQIGALMRISHRGACGVSDLGDELGVTNAAASQMLERLVQGGLVERREDPDDRRAKRIALTERGSRLVQGTVEMRLRQFAELADRLDPPARTRAAAALRTLVEHSGLPPHPPIPAAAATSPRSNAKEHSSR